MIPEISNILYASDLGENSRPAFLLAAKEAFKHDAQITFLNIVEPASKSTETMMENYMADGEMKEMRSQGMKAIQDLMEQRIQEFYDKDLAGKIPLQHRPLTRIEEGAACETIIKVADEIDADLIVMGTRNRNHSTLGRFFVGSTAQNVLQLTDRPVLIVPL
ncbi:universal stress protein [Neptuniibacter sp.]|uniref:universal stress protein n=1 Tax=Neptuniibacter sp. TaxID=1962643 RepID=UPI002620377E|nr:universal stress protein [Neptuniibacter sp.]MCP4596531.1 universal stress protein [Neptuniibacter sp.]